MQTTADGDGRLSTPGAGGEDDGYETGDIVHRLSTRRTTTTQQATVMSMRSTGSMSMETAESAVLFGSRGAHDNIERSFSIETYAKIRETGGPMPAGRPKLTKTILFVLACIDFADCVNILLLMPYVASMVSDFMQLPVHHPQVLYNVGLLVGVYNVAEFLFSPFWGWLSNAIGRRKALLLGFGGVAVVPLFFGSSQSLAEAFAMRALNGVFCGNLSVTKTYLAELVDEDGEASAFSMLAFTYGLGMIVGPALGGLLVHPARWAPAVFEDSVFERLPYLLPNLVYSVLALAAWCLGALVLVETLPHEERRCGCPRAETRAVAAGGERRRLRQMLPILSYPKELRRMMLAWALSVSYSICASQTFVLLMALPGSVHGFALVPRTIGLLQNCAGAGLLVTQLCFFPRWARSRGYRWCATAGICLVICVTLPFPLYGLMWDEAEYGPWRLLPLAAMMFLLESGFCLAVPTTTIWINRHAESVDRGMVNGITNSLGAACRALAPFLGSSLLALGLHSGVPLGRYLPWLVMAVFGVIIICLSRSSIPGLGSEDGHDGNGKGDLSDGDDNNSSEEDTSSGSSDDAARACC